MRLTKQNLGWPMDATFYIPKDALSIYRAAVEKGKAGVDEWESLLKSYRQEYPDLFAEFEQTLAGDLPVGWDQDVPVFPPDSKGMATREASGETLNALAHRVPSLIGGSADLNPSTRTALAGLGDFQDPDAVVTDKQGAVGPGWDRAGRNLAFGVREHAMGAITNGLAAHGGSIPFASTFFIFSDYMRPPMRLAALMKLHVLYVFTHDSVGLREDGPTHEPVEQLANLRAVPNLMVIRPADANETAVAWKVAAEHRGGPVALVLTRQKVPTIDRGGLASAEELRRGGYVLAEARSGRPADVLLIGSGSEVALTLEARGRLGEEGVQARVVSMPSWELFEQQEEAYKQRVLPPRLQARVAVEAGAIQGWDRYVGNRGAVIGIDCFGASAPGATVLREYGFTVERVCDAARVVLAKETDQSEAWMAESWGCGHK